MSKAAIVASGIPPSDVSGSLTASGVPNALTDSTFGCLGDSSTTEEGWRMLFEGGFKTWIERKR